MNTQRKYQTKHKLYCVLFFKATWAEFVFETSHSLKVYNSKPLWLKTGKKKDECCFPSHIFFLFMRESLIKLYCGNPLNRSGLEKHFEFSICTETVIHPSQPYTRRILTPACEALITLRVSLKTKDGTIQEKPSGVPKNEHHQLDEISFKTSPTVAIFFNDQLHYTYC